MENLEVMVILFIIVVLGYALCKLGYMGDKFDQKLSSIVIDVTCPALILSSVMGDGTARPLVDIAPVGSRFPHLRRAVGVRLLGAAVCFQGP